MYIVSFETAKKLKDAGFPQPESGFPLIWYGISDFDGADGRRHETYGTVITMLGYMAMPYVVPLSFSENVELGKGKYKELIFAPTATDILRVLWFLFDLKFGGNGKWLVCRTNSLSDGPSPFHEHDNPAEACAAAWLEENKKNG